MFVFILIAIAFSGKLKEYEVISSTTIHKYDTFKDINEGANPFVYADSSKLGLLTFDFDKDFRKHEIIEAYLELDVEKFNGEKKVQLCFLSEPIYVEGTGSFYGVDVLEQVTTSPDGATYYTYDGSTSWDIEDLLVCRWTYKTRIPFHQQGKFKVEITRQLLKYSEQYTDNYKSPGTFTLVILSNHRVNNLKIDSTNAIVTVETLDRQELFSDSLGDIVDFHVFMGEAELDYLNADPYAEEYALCDVIYDGYTYSRAGCRYKGGVSTLRLCCTNESGVVGPLNTDVCRKLSFKIDTYEFRGDVDSTGSHYFPKSERKRKIYNQKKINFLGMESIFKDDILREVDVAPWIQYYDQMAIIVASVLMRASGVEMAFSKFAKLYMNYDYWGLYTMMEQTDDKFTEDRYSYDDNEGEGQLWKEISFNTPTVEYFLDRLKEGDENMTWIVDMVTELNNLDPVTPEAKLFVETHFNVNTILRILAVNEIIGNPDSFHLMKCVDLNELGCTQFESFKLSNTYFYRRVLNGVSNLEIISHDLDNSAIGYYNMKARPWYDENYNATVACVTGEPGVNVSDTLTMFILPAQCTPLFKILKLHFIEEYKDLVNHLADNIITEGNIEMLVEKYSGVIEDYIDVEPTGIPTESEWVESVGNFMERLVILRQETVDRVNLL